MSHVNSLPQYSQYVDTQTQINLAKFQRTSLTLNEVRAINDYFRTQRPDLLHHENFFAVCQGVRNGAEIRAFSKSLRKRVIGTDISASILRVPNGVLCDFSDCPKLWNGKVDFLYTNSYDHAQDINYTLGVWRDLLSAKGLMFLQFTPEHAIDMRISLEELKQKLVVHRLAVQTIIELKPQQSNLLIDLLHNVTRRVLNLLARTILPTSSRLYWDFSYTLKRGTDKPVHIIVAGAT